MSKVPCVLRTLNKVPTLLTPSLPWGLDTMGAYSSPKGWHEASEELTGKGRACTEEEARGLLKEAQGTLPASAVLAPQARVGQATHEARKAKALGLSQQDKE